MKDSFILSHKAFEVKQGRNMEYKLIKSKRKTVELTIDDELCPVIKAPLNMPPPEAIDYVVVHELAHIVYKNHSAKFYALVAKYLPDYKEREKLLR